MAATNGQTKHEVLDSNSDRENMLEKMRTTNSIFMSPELFEKIYLSPQNKVSGDLRKTFANPTPLALGGFLLCLTPLSCDLMGWRGAGGSGAAGIATYFFFGGLLMLLGSLLEFILGNTFPFVVFGTFGAFWLSYGGTLQPYFNAAGSYSSDGLNQAEGLGTAGFANSFSFFLVFMGLLCLIYLIASIRTNIVFFGIFLSLVFAFGFLAGSFWHAGQGNASLASKLQIGGGACAFVTSMLGWYLFFVQVLASVDFPLSLPVGDLSNMIKGASDRRRDAHENHARV